MVSLLLVQLGAPLDQTSDCSLVAEKTQNEIFYHACSKKVEVPYRVHRSHTARFPFQSRTLGQLGCERRRIKMNSQGSNPWTRFPQVRVPFSARAALHSAFNAAMMSSIICDGCPLLISAHLWRMPCRSPNRPYHIACLITTAAAPPTCCLTF